MAANNTRSEAFKVLFPAVVGVILAIMQGFVVYYTKNVDQRLSSMDAKLDRTWEMTLKTTTEVATLKERIAGQTVEIENLKAVSAQTREQLAALKGQFEY
jgi:hypothetical protein